MKAYTHKLGIASIAILAAAAGTGIADAQEADGGSTVETVVVTATRRAENIQNVPVSVTAIAGDDLSKFSIATPDDLLASVPGLSTVSSGGAFLDDISIRGVGTSRIDTSQSATGIFRDGMFIGNGTFFGRIFSQFDMFDMKDVEVYRGPQGALWGRNSAGGAIEINTAHPVMDQFEASATASYEVEQAAEVLKGVVNVPLGDDLAIRVSALYDYTAGGLTKVQDASSPLNGMALDKSYVGGVRIGLRWQPTDDFDATLTIEDSTSETPSFTDVFSRLGRGDPNRFAYACTTQYPTASKFFPGQHCSFNNADDRQHVDTANAFFDANWHVGGGDLEFSALGTSREARVNDDYDVFIWGLAAPTLGLNPATGALAFGAAINSTNGVAPSPNSQYPRTGQFRKVGYQLIYTSDSTARFRWLFGVDDYHSYDNYLQVNSVPFISPFSAAAGPIPPGGLIADLLVNQYNVRHSFSESAFGSVEYDILDNLTATLEGRVTHNNTLNDGTNSTVIACPPSAPLPTTCATPNQSLSTTVVSGANIPVNETVFTPVGTLSYKVIPGQQVYLRYATGFRPAGFDTRTGGAGFLGAYRAERDQSAEVGWKGSLLDNMTFDVDAYYSRATNLQIQDTFVGTDGVARSRLGNAPHGFAWGAEAEIDGQWSVGPGTLDAGLSYAYSNGVIHPYLVTQATACATPTPAGYPAPPGLVSPGNFSCYSQYSGKRLPQTSDYQVVLRTGYSAPLTLFSDASWFINAQYSGSGGGYLVPTDTIPLSRMNTVNGTLGFNLDRWRFDIFGRNIGNSIYRLEVIGPGTVGVTNVYSQPRTWGMELSVHF